MACSYRYKPTCMESLIYYIHLFVHKICYQHFSYVLYQTNNFQHKANTLMYLRDTFHNSDPLKRNFGYTNYIDIQIFNIKFKEIMTIHLSKLDFNYFSHIYVPSNNNSCHHWRQKLLEIRGLAQSKYSSRFYNRGHTL